LITNFESLTSNFHLLLPIIYQILDMLNTILGSKLHMTQVFDQSGLVRPATLVQAGPCWITQVKTTKTDGYSAVQISFGSRKHPTNPQAGHVKKAGLNQFPRYIREVRLSPDQPTDQLQPGVQVNLQDVLQPGDLVTVTGISKGKGFTGVVKRHGFAGGPRTHGQSDRLRAPGSIGAGTTPGRVYKGKKMAGRSGGQQVTVKGLLILSVDPQTHQVLIQGALPGHRHSLITIKKIGHQESFTGLTRGHHIPDAQPQAPVEAPQETPEENQPTPKSSTPKPSADTSSADQPESTN
jgi:large subunit ribosomal protein L3